jgi:hypothetical protein
MAGNFAGAFGNGGGGLAVEPGATCTLVNCTLDGNAISDGFVNGGGLFCAAGGQASLVNCTVTRNLGDGNGVFSAGKVQLLNTLVAGNSNDLSAYEPATDLSGAIVSLGHNLIESRVPHVSGLAPTDQVGIDPHAGPVQDNGGPVPTCALPDGSAARRAGTSSGAPPTDARGAPHPAAAGANPDVGAYQSSEAPILALGGGRLAVHPGDPPQPLEPFATLALADDVTLDGGTLSIQSSGPVQLSVDLSAGYGITVVDGTIQFGTLPIGTVLGLGGPALSVSLGGSVTRAAVQALVRSLSIAAPAPVPDLTPVTITWSITDGTGDSFQPPAGMLLLLPPSTVASSPGAMDSSFPVSRGTPVHVQPPGIMAGAYAATPSTTLRPVMIDPAVHGDLALHPDGSFDYRPSVGFSGEERFTFRATDGTGLGNLATVSLQVSADPPASTPGVALSGQATFTIPNPDFPDESAAYRLTMEISTSRSGLTRGTFLLWDTPHHREVISSHVFSLVVNGTHARIFATALQVRVPGHVHCVIDLDLQPGAPDGVRFETDAFLTLLGPVPLDHSSLSLRPGR